MKEKKLFLLDAMALIYRAYYALIKSPRVTSKGMNTSAIFGFTNILLELLKKEKGNITFTIECGFANELKEGQSV